MTRKRQAFAREYAKDSNATQAAIRAGYSAKTAGQQGEQLLKKLEVQNYLAEIYAKAEAAAIASHTECCEALTEIVRASLSALVDDAGQIDPAQLRTLLQTRAVQELTEEAFGESAVRRRVKLRDPVRAIEALAKLRGYNAPDEQKVDTTLTVNIKYTA